MQRDRQKESTDFPPDGDSRPNDPQKSPIDPSTGGPTESDGSPDSKDLTGGEKLGAFFLYWYGVGFFLELYALLGSALFPSTLQLFPVLPGQVSMLIVGSIAIAFVHYRPVRAWPLFTFVLVSAIAFFTIPRVLTLGTFLSTTGPALAWPQHLQVIAALGLSHALGLLAVKHRFE